MVDILLWENSSLQMLCAKYDKNIYNAGVILLIKGPLPKSFFLKSLLIIFISMQMRFFHLP